MGVADDLALFLFCLSLLDSFLPVGLNINVEKAGLKIAAASKPAGSKVASVPPLQKLYSSGARGSAGGLLVMPRPRMMASHPV